MDIYAPLAERIGMYEFMTEMQTLAFRELEPDAYASISKRLEQLHKGGGDLIDRIGRGLKAHLEANGIEAEVQGREKHPLFDLAQDGRAPRQLRAIVRRDGLPGIVAAMRNAIAPSA
jgi:hypothetical protein